MPNLKLDVLGVGGLLTDQPPTQLPPNAINSLTNGLCKDGSIQFIGGNIALFSISIRPLFYTIYIPPGTTNNQFIVSDGFTVMSYDTEGHEKILKENLNGGNITFTVLNAILVFNSETDGPFFLNLTTDAVESLPGWDPDWRCKQIIAFKYYLVALNFKENTQEIPYLIRWSVSADPGAIPNSWTPEASNDAGDVIIADTPGTIVTSLQITNALWIIKEDSIYILQWVGGQYIFQTQKLTDMIGSRIPLGVCEFQSGLAILTNDDLFYFNGQSLQSLTKGIISNKIFKGIGDKWRYAQLFSSSRKGMLFLGAPSSSSGFLLNDIYILNTIDNGWSHKDFYCGYGFEEGFVKKTLVPTPAWDDAVTTWNTQLGIWDEGEFDPADKQMILYRANPDDTAWWIEVWNSSFKTNKDSQPIIATAGRSGIPLVLSNQIVMIKDIWVEVTGDVESVDFYVGIQKAQESPIIKQGPWKITPNVTNKFSPRLTGRFFYWEIDVKLAGTWRVHSLIVDFMPAGER